ncbi:MAG: DNA mismatch repair protein MutS [Nitrospinota bacterium]|nr:DNA mismatch repair protein MutS [Nitrospinota bacterium]
MDTKEKKDKETKNLSPAMKQYMELKKKYCNEFLFFQMGDFYEMFYEDAKSASEILGITLTSRNKDSDGPIPMCGVPRHSSDSYCARLLEEGFKVAICDQVENASESKGIVKREVVRVLSPGTSIVGDHLTESKESQFLFSLSVSGKDNEFLCWGLSWVDVTTGAFYAIEIDDDLFERRFFSELERLRPKEILLQNKGKISSSVLSILEIFDVRIENLPDDQIDDGDSYEYIRKNFGSEKVFKKIDTKSPMFIAAGNLIKYLKNNRLGDLPHLKTIVFPDSDEMMFLDAVTQTNLELVYPSDKNRKSITLFNVLDYTSTALGGRLLKDWILSPLLKLRKIKERTDAVEEFKNKRTERKLLIENLSNIKDLERIQGRIGLQNSNARDMKALSDSISFLPKIEGILKTFKSREIKKIISDWDSLKDIEKLLSSSLNEELPLSIKDGEMFADGVNKELDELRKIIKNGKSWLKNYEAVKKEETNLPLKIGYNRVFGYYIDLPRRFSSKVPEDFSRKQTLVSSERFVTKELKEIEEKLEYSEEKSKELEFIMFGELRNKIAKNSKRILNISKKIAQMDVMLSLAKVADQNDYVRANINNTGDIEIVQGRHPVLDTDFSTTFVPNDLIMNSSRKIMIVTGPNMSGKSTFLRQTALIILMAQMGSFVPAKSAKIGIADRIFTRVGAHDLLSEGKSTFMVEMLETSEILNEASANSFIVFDEVGRGTSTYDGVSIAWAIVEFLHNNKNRQARTLFATHYHELSVLEKKLSKVINLTVDVREQDQEVVFLRKVIDGICNKSYGLHVGKLAGLPDEILIRAYELMENFELSNKGQDKLSEGLEIQKNKKKEKIELANGPNFRDLIDEISLLDPDSMSPKDALDTIYKFKKIFKKTSTEKYF